MAQSKATAQPGGGVLYEIRKDGVTYCQSYMENCGYTTDRLKKMREAGYELYANGKKVKRR